MNAQENGLDLAAIAVEVGRIESGIGEMSFATMLESTIAAGARARLEHAGAKIGLSPKSTRLVLDQVERRATLLGDAHRLLLVLLPFEGAIRALSTPRQPIATAFPSQEPAR